MFVKKKKEKKSPSKIKTLLLEIFVYPNFQVLFFPPQDGAPHLSFGYTAVSNEFFRLSIPWPEYKPNSVSPNMDAKERQMP